MDGLSTDDCREREGVGGGPIAKPVNPVPPPTVHFDSMSGTHDTSQSPASNSTSSPSRVATPGNQTPLHVASYCTRTTKPSEVSRSLPRLVPSTVHDMSPLTSLIPTLRRPSVVCGSCVALSGRAHLMRILSVLGKEPWMPQPSAKPAEVDASLDSSSEKL